MAQTASIKTLANIVTIFSRSTASRLGVLSKLQISRSQNAGWSTFVPKRNDWRDRASVLVLSIFATKCVFNEVGASLGVRNTKGEASSLDSEIAEKQEAGLGYEAKF